MPSTSLPVYYANPAGDLFEHPAGFALIQYHAGRRAAGLLPALLTKAGELLVRRGWHCLLSDTRVLTPLTEEEKQWLSKQWQAQLVPRPPQLWIAIVQSVDVFSRLAVGQVQHGVQPGNIAYRNFNSQPEAEAYLAGIARQKKPR